MLDDAFPWFFLRLFDKEGGAGGGEAVTADADDGAQDDATDSAVGGDDKSEGDQGGSDDGQGDVDGDASTPWGENWRDDIVNGLGLEGDALKKAKGQVQRWTSPVQVAKSALAASQKITELTESQKGMIKVPGKNATAEERAAYHKAIGVPESPDKYELPPPEEGDEHQFNDFEQQTVERLREEAQKLGLSQDQFKGVFSMFGRFEKMAESSIQERANRLAEETEDTLRGEWGREYKPNMELANRFLGERLGEDAEDLLSMRLADGTTLGAQEKWVRMFVELAREHADDGALLDGVTPEGLDIEKRIDEIYELRTKDKKKYESQQIQDELIRLTGLMERRKQAAA